MTEKRSSDSSGNSRLRPESNYKSDFPKSGQSFLLAVKQSEILPAKYKIDIDLSSLERVKMTDWVAEIKADGIKEGRNRKSAEDIIAMMNEFGCTLEKALEVVHVAESDRELVLELVRELQASS